MICSPRSTRSPGATGANASNVATGAAAGKINLSTGTAQDLVLTDNGVGQGGSEGDILAKLGLSAGTTARLSTPATAPAITGDTALSGAVGTDSLQSGFTAGQSIKVNGTTINFVASGATGNDVNITDSVDDLLAKIDTITGGTGSTVVNGKIQLKRRYGGEHRSHRQLSCRRSGQARPDRWHDAEEHPG